MRLRETFAEIRLDNLAHNIRYLKSLPHDPRFFCPMVKADAYGHGDIEVCKVLDQENVRWVGVSLVEEAIRLRVHGVPSRILTFAFFDQKAAKELIRLNITPVISDWEQVEQLSEFLTETQKFPVHIKFNTGMNRLGFDESEAKKVSAFFRSSTKFKVEGVCTHLLQSDDALDSEGRTQEQIQRFAVLKTEFNDFSPIYHVQNSGALLLGAEPRSGARPGLAIYGVLPDFNSTSASVTPTTDALRTIDKLLPVMTLKSSIGIIRRVKKGETVSYGGNWAAQRDSIIGVIPIGYADGYLRNFSNRAQLLYREQRVPVIGTVCMDYIMVDLTNALSAGEPSIGESVVLFGQQGESNLKVAELAKVGNTISYEVLTGVSKRIPRVYV